MTIPTFEQATQRHRDGDVHGALDGYARLACLHAGEGMLLHLIGLAFQQIGHPALAANWLRRAAAVKGPEAPLQHQLGEAAWAAGMTGAALDAYRLALAGQPDLVESRISLALLLRETGAFDLARAEARRALAIAPGHARAHLADGLAREHVDGFARAVAVDPHFAGAWTNLGAMHHRDGRPGLAARATRRTLALLPDNGAAWSNYGAVLLGLGHPGPAIRRQRRSLVLQPTPQLHSNLLFSMLSDPLSGDIAMLREARTWARRYAPAAAAAPSTWPNARDPERRLVLGYVSSDFRRHPVAGNVEPLLHGRDRRRFALHCYAEIGAPDEVTARIAASADRWTPILGQDDAAVAAAIRAAGVDILVFLGGHTANQRLGIAAHRAAPIQISFHAPSTTGIEVMDYWLSDPVLTPAGWEERFSEKILRIPALYTFQRPGIPEQAMADHDPETLVFGSFNNPSKLNDAVLDTWRRILVALPRARLQLGYHRHFSDPGLQRRVLDGLGDADLAGRVDFLPSAPDAAAHFARLAATDIILDTFPFGGATSSFDALWMGVPVITLAGDRFVGRVGAALLPALGAADLVASDLDDYVGRAIGLAGDALRRRDLRGSLRTRLERSPFLDHPAQVQAYEAALRSAWRRWCGSGDLGPC
jgi:protein O-GlcNAc transferase